MAKKKTKENVNKYMVILPGEFSAISVGESVYPVQSDNCILLTADEAAPLLADGFIELVPEKPASKSAQPALDLLAEKSDQEE